MSRTRDLACSVLGASCGAVDNVSPSGSMLWLRQGHLVGPVPQEWGRAMAAQIGPGRVLSRFQGTNGCSGTRGWGLGLERLLSRREAWISSRFLQLVLKRAELDTTRTVHEAAPVADRLAVIQARAAHWLALVIGAAAIGVAAAVHADVTELHVREPRWDRRRLCAKRGERPVTGHVESPRITASIREKRSSLGT